MTFKKLLGLSVVVMFAFTTITMTSCTKTQGCTDPKSDNYSADAEEDDGTCVAWSEKFVGDFDVQLGCAHPAFAGLNVPFTMQITKTSATNINLTLVTGALGTVPLTGVVDGDTFLFDKLEVAEIVTAVGTLTDVVISGGGKIEADKSLSGDIAIVAGGSPIGALTDNCTLIATRQ